MRIVSRRGVPKGGISSFWMWMSTAILLIAASGQLPAPEASRAATHHSVDSGFVLKHAPPPLLPVRLRCRVAKQHLSNGMRRVICQGVQWKGKARIVLVHWGETIAKRVVHAQLHYRFNVDHRWVKGYWLEATPL